MLVGGMVVVAHRCGLCYEEADIRVHYACMQEAKLLIGLVACVVYACRIAVSCIIGILFIIVYYL